VAERSVPSSGRKISAIQWQKDQCYPVAERSVPASGRKISAIQWQKDQCHPVAERSVLSSGRKISAIQWQKNQCHPVAERSVLSSGRKISAIQWLAVPHLGCPPNSALMRFILEFLVSLLWSASNSDCKGLYVSYQKHMMTLLLRQMSMMSSYTLALIEQQHYRAPYDDSVTHTSSLVAT